MTSAYVVDTRLSNKDGHSTLNPGYAYHDAR